MSRIQLLVGTKKGAFILEADGARSEWKLRGPFCDNWPIQRVSHDPATGVIYAAGGSEWYGPAVWRSADQGATWSHSSAGLGYGDDGPKLRGVWTVVPAHGRLYAGVEPAGLFESADGGLQWRHVHGLRDHPSRPTWQPGGGGLILHAILAHPTDARQLWVAISTGGTFYTQDGGATWTPQNVGVRADFMPERYPEVGQCVHGLVMAPGQPERLYQQNHCGVYRSADGGKHWEEITTGLPSQFGFPMAVHPRQPDTIYVVPLNGEDKGRFVPEAHAAVWRSADAGQRWERLSAGLPQEGAYLGVLRHALAVDRLEPAGVYFGTSTGQLFGSRDEGASWRLVAQFLPPIRSVEAAVLDG